MVEVEVVSEANRWLGRADEKELVVREGRPCHWSQPGPGPGLELGLHAAGGW